MKFDFCFLLPNFSIFKSLSSDVSLSFVCPLIVIHRFGIDDEIVPVTIVAKIAALFCLLAVFPNDLIDSCIEEVPNMFGKPTVLKSIL